MRKLFALLVILAVAISASPQNIKGNEIVLANVAVIDVKNGSVITDMNLRITGNRITAISKSELSSTSPKAKIIDAKGKFLIPGLWDMHVHMMIEGGPGFFLPLFVSNGVTGIRDMGGSFPLERIIKLRDSIQAGEITGPRIGAMTGKILDGPVVTMDVGIAVPNPDEGRKIVRQYKEEGADFIKVYNLLSRDIYVAVMDEAKKQGIPVAGHIPFSMTAAEASDLGQVTVEHAASAATVPVEIFISCSTEEAELRAQIEKERATGQDTRQLKEAIAAKSYDEKKAKALFGKFVRNETWQCPTMVLNYANEAGDSSRLASDPRLRYIPNSMINRWNAMLK